MRVNVANIDDYISQAPEPVQPLLNKVRSAIRRKLPADATESISYGIPTFKLNGRVVLYFAAWKEHISVYPAMADMLKEVPELEPYQASKGTLKFPLSAPVPLRLIERAAKFHVSRVRKAAVAKAAGKPRSKG